MSPRNLFPLLRSPLFCSDPDAALDGIVVLVLVAANELLLRRAVVLVDPPQVRAGDPDLSTPPARPSFPPSLASRMRDDTDTRREACVRAEMSVNLRQRLELIGFHLALVELSGGVRSVNQT